MARPLPNKRENDGSTIFWEDYFAKTYACILLSTPR